LLWVFSLHSQVLSHFSFALLTFIICLHPGNAPRLLSPVITFIGYGIIVKVSGNEAPSTANIFSALSLLSILVDPVNELVAIGPNLAAALDCFNRVQEYVMKEKRVDYRNLSLNGEEKSGTPPEETSDERRITTIASLEPKPVNTAIRLVNVDAGWSKKTLALRNITLNLHPSTLNIVIGDIGSGKSSLLKLLLGEVPVLAKGSVSLETDEIAFCGQTPFLRNQSIRDNIIGPLSYDFEWYNACINACALDVDFEQMPHKDSTIAGSRGISLSGGQKQRIVSLSSLFILSIWLPGY
jgi:ATP-binding cassette, subfamily C (CFTR/MRP), member 1